MALVVGLFLATAAAPAEARVCPGGRSGNLATFFSAVHAGVGEYYLKGWGSFENMPQMKFWLGWIPLYGWPYLSVRSAIDANRCKTLDRAY
jgi:hypothetical protein